MELYTLTEFAADLFITNKISEQVLDSDFNIINEYIQILGNEVYMKLNEKYPDKFPPHPNTWKVL